MVIMNIICRTCLEQNQKYISIFDYHENGKMLSDMLLDCTTVKVQKHDGLPLFICNFCLEKLSSLWSFRVMVIETDLKLHNYLKNNTIQNSSFAQTSYIKEEYIIDKNEIASSTMQENTCKINSIGTKLSLVNMPSLNEYNCTNYLRKENDDLDITLVKNNNTDESLDQFNHALTSEDNNEVSKIVKGGTEEMFRCAKIDETEITSSVKPRVSNNSLDLHKARIKPADQNFSSCYVSDNVNNGENINVTQIQKEFSTCSEINVETCDNKDDIMLEDKFHCDEPISNSDISNEGIMEESLHFEKINKKLTRKEKEKMSVHCKTCNRSFGYRYYFEVHVKHHSGDKKFKCDICGKAFVRQFQLRLHMSVHSFERPVSCETCGKTFKNLSALCSHKTIHGDGTLLICNICKKSYKSKSSLKSHIQRHKSEKRYTCELCGKSFGESSSLRKHKLSHVDGKNFACPTCGKAFSTNVQMRAHLKLHSDARPHSCSYCGRSFKTKDVMDTHILIHTGERPHSCKICDKPFRQTSALYKHMRIHTGETPYACDICPSRFKYSHHLQSHRKIHK